MDKDQLRNECVKLRVQQKLGFREILRQTKVSKHSLAEWLKLHPLTQQQLKENSCKISVKTECIRLKVEERLSVKEIELLTGASRGSVSSWLKAYPLSQEEQKLKMANTVRYKPARKDRGETSELYKSMNVIDLSRSEKGRIAECAVSCRSVEISNSRV